MPPPTPPPPLGWGGAGAWSTGGRWLYILVVCVSRHLSIRCVEYGREVAHPEQHEVLNYLKCIANFSVRKQCVRWWGGPFKGGLAWVHRGLAWVLRGRRTARPAPDWPCMRASPLRGHRSPTSPAPSRLRLPATCRVLAPRERAPQPSPPAARAGIRPLPPPSPAARGPRCADAASSQPACYREAVSAWPPLR